MKLKWALMHLMLCCLCDGRPNYAITLIFGLDIPDWEGIVLSKDFMLKTCLSQHGEVSFHDDNPVSYATCNLP